MRAWRLLMRLASVPPGGLRAEVSRLDCSANAVIPFTSPPGDDASTLVVATGAVPVFLGLGALPQRLHIGETGVRRRAPFRRQPLFDAAETPIETIVGFAQRGFRIALGIACDVAAHQQEIADFMAQERRGAARRHLGAQLGAFFFELRHHLLELFPIETDPRHAALQFYRAGQGRPGAVDAVQHARRSIAVLGRTLAGLVALPLLALLRGVRHPRRAEHVRMAARELGDDGIDYG